MINWTSETMDEVIEEDAETGDKILNPNGEVILVTRPEAIPILEITRYEHYPFDPTIITYFENTLNLLDFYGSRSGTVWCYNIEAPMEVIENTRYCKVTYRFKFRIKWDEDGNQITNTWQTKTPLRGFFIRRLDENGALTKPELFTDANGNTGEVLLNADGTHNNVEPIVPVIKIINTMKKTIFGGMGLPEP